MLMKELPSQGLEMTLRLSDEFLLMSTSQNLLRTVRYVMHLLLAGADGHGQIAVARVRERKVTHPSESRVITAGTLVLVSIHPIGRVTR